MGREESRVELDFGRKLLDWFAEHGRRLPWRGTKDPYLVWVSEIILQQTRVAQGYDYFVRFVSRFPDVSSLAAAEEDEVMTYWQGLGYYSRARHLLQAARSMNGCFPQTYAEVRALPGVGDYTAAAICSIAYDMPYAVVDGNVYRVLARVFGIDTPIDSTIGRKLFAQLAQELLDKHQPSAYNQAIMDFGATVCTPQSPACESCPLADVCSALASGQVDRLPMRSHRTKVSERWLNYFFVSCGDWTLIRKRIGNDIWRNLYEFPLIETPHSMELAELLRLPEWEQLSALWGAVPAELRTIVSHHKHVLTHRVLHASFHLVSLPPSTRLTCAPIPPIISPQISPYEPSGSFKTSPAIGPTSNPYEPSESPKTSPTMGPTLSPCEPAESPKISPVIGPTLNPNEPSESPNAYTVVHRSDIGNYAFPALLQRFLQQIF